MSFLLDSDICSAHLRRPSGFAHRFFQHAGRLFISSVNLGELHAWAHHLRDPQPVLAKISDLLIDVQVLSFDAACGEEFGRLRGTLLKQGISVPTADLMIAATALVHDLTLITHNTADFRHIPGLRLDDWLLP
jgi:predicted nucleic acid-binding protein